jgi:uncharacterized cupin superfamily protein
LSIRKTNIHSASFEEDESQTGEEPWRFLDLSGHHLGVRIEITSPGSTTSHHHYHTTEEEHVLVIAGTATLHMDDDTVELVEGDHIWFQAGEEVAHHIENTSDSPFRFLVFGESKKDDVVFYPKDQVLFVKSSLGNKLFTYRQK